MQSALNQSAQDFRAMRSRAGAEGAAAIDSIYEDFALTKDDFTALNEELPSIVANMCNRFHGYVTQYYVADEQVCIYVNIDNCKSSNSSVEDFAKKVIVHSLLAWWYDVRLAELANVYRDKAAQGLSQLMSIVIPTFGRRRLRMF